MARRQRSGVHDAEPDYLGNGDAFPPGISRLLSELRHEVIVAHVRNVRLIGGAGVRANCAQPLLAGVILQPTILVPVSLQCLFPLKPEVWLVA